MGGREETNGAKYTLGTAQGAVLTHPLDPRNPTFAKSAPRALSGGYFAPTEPNGAKYALETARGAVLTHPLGPEKPTFAKSDLR